MGQVLGKLRHGKDGGVIFADDLPEEFPDLDVGSGDIDMAAPDPFIRRFFLNKRYRLRIMYINYIPVNIDLI